MTVFLTPTETGGDAIELSTTTFRKKILPKGKIKYGEREIVFDDEYLTDLATSFKDGAYDQVPYMLADEQNRHTMDPERFRGECKSVEVAEDGLYGTFELSGDAADLIRKNPKLGVSARIVEGYQRSDGKTYSRSLQHVLGTLDPRIPGMGAWEEIELSNGETYTSSDVIDLSNSVYEEEGTVSEKKNEASDVPVSDQAAFAALKEAFPDWEDSEIQELLDTPLTDEELATAQAELDEAAKKTEEQPKQETAKEEPKAEEAPKAETAKDDEKELVSLSNEVVTGVTDTRTVDLANQVAQLQATVAQERFAKEKAEWVRNGVPPALVDLSRDVLTAPRGSVIDLSNGVEESKVDAGEVIRKLLTQCAGYIEFAAERGHTVSLSNEDGDESAQRDEVLSAWRAMDESYNPHKR